MSAFTWALGFAETETRTTRFPRVRLRSRTARRQRGSGHAGLVDRADPLAAVSRARPKSAAASTSDESANGTASSAS